MPWFRADVNDWPEVAELLPRPWPESAIRIDLAWWTDQTTMGRQRWPSEREAAERWGVGRWKARAILNEWRTNQSPTTYQPVTNHLRMVEPGKQTTNQPVTNHLPTSHQPAPLESGAKTKQSEALQTTDYRLQTSTKEREGNARGRARARLTAEQVLGAHTEQD